MTLDLLAYKQASDAASLATEEGKMAAQMEDVAALQRETDRKLELANAISTSRASASGRGIVSGVGSPLSVIKQMVSQEKTDTSRDKFNAKINAQSARYSAAAKAGQIRGQAGLSLLKSIEGNATSFATGGGGAGGGGAGGGSIK